MNRNQSMNVWLVLAAIAAIAALLAFGQLAVAARAQAQTPTPAPPKPTPRPGFQERIEKIPCPALEGNLLGDPAERTVHVILPPGYATSDTRYPALYAIGGGDGEPIHALGFKTAMVSQYIRGEIRDMILVIPDGTNSLGGSQFRSSPVIGDYETCFTRDIVGYVDSHYRTLPSRDSRALSGCCGGGVTSMRLGLKYPDVFSVVAATDAGLDESLEAWPGDVDWVKRLKKLPESLIEARMDSVMAWFIQAAAGVAPDPDNPPFYCQMPIRIVDGHGEFVPEVIAKKVDDDAVHRARRYVQQSERLRGIYLRKSLYDPEYDLPMLNFVQVLNDLGIEHEYEEVKTGHCGLGWEDASLKFIASKLVFEE